MVYQTIKAINSLLLSSNTASNTGQDSLRIQGFATKGNCMPRVRSFRKDRRLNQTASLALILNTGRLGPVHGQFKLSQELEGIVNRQLPEGLRNSVRVVYYRNNKLLLSSSSPSQTTRIQYILPELKARLKHNILFESLEEIRIRVSYLPPRKKPVTINRSLSRTSADNLRELAEVVGNKALKAALKSLVKNSD